MCPTTSGATEHGAGGPELLVGKDPDTPKLPSDMVSRDMFYLSQRQTAQLGLENERLCSQLKEVIGMNTRWQKYDKEREAYILRLHEANKELLGKLSSVQKMYSDLQQQISRQKLQEERPDILGAAASSSENVKKAKETASGGTSQLCALDGKLARMEKEVATLTDTVERLQEENTFLKRTQANRQKNEEERIAIFKEQLNVCLEDFRQERSDREKMHTEKLHLRRQLDDAENTITRLRQEINDLIEETRWLHDRPSRLTHHYAHPVTEPSRPTLHFNYYTKDPSNPNQYVKKVMVPPNRMTGGAGYDIPDLDSVDSNVTVDGCTESLEVSSPVRDSLVPPLVSLSLQDKEEGNTSTIPPSVKEEDQEDYTPHSAAWKQEEPLRCPQCLVKFLVEDHTKLLKHIEECSGEKEESAICASFVE